MPSNDTFIVRDNRGPKYLKVYNDFYDTFGAELGPYGLAVYVALCRYIDVDNSDCNPSYNTIAKGTGMSRRKVIYEIQKMERLRIITVERNHHTSNVFILLDTSAQHAPLPSAQHAPPSARRAPKQESIKKNTRHTSNKKKIYRPDEYRDIILG